MAVVRKNAIVVFEHCSGERAWQLAEVVADGLAGEAGMFHVWIGPGPAVGHAEVVIEKDRWRRSFACTTQAAPEEINRLLKHDHATELIPGR